MESILRRLSSIVRETLLLCGLTFLHCLKCNAYFSSIFSVCSSIYVSIYSWLSFTILWILSMSRFSTLDLTCSKNNFISFISVIYFSLITSNSSTLVSTSVSDSSISFYRLFTLVSIVFRLPVNAVNFLFISLRFSSILVTCSNFAPSFCFLGEGSYEIVSDVICYLCFGFGVSIILVLFCINILFLEVFTGSELIFGD